MAKYRSLQTSFWEDENVLENYTPEERFFFIYVLENKDVTQCGIYHFSIKKAALHTGYSEEKIRELLITHQNVHKTIRYNGETKEIAVRNFLKYNNIPSPAVQKCIQNGFACVKDKSLVSYVLHRGDVEETAPVFVTIEDEAPENAPNDTAIYEDRPSPEGNDTVNRRSIDDGGEKEKKEKEKNKNIIIEKTVCAIVDTVDNSDDELDEIQLPPEDIPNTAKIIAANYSTDVFALTTHLYFQIRNKRLERDNLGVWKEHHPNTLTWLEYIHIIHETENTTWDDMIDIIDYVVSSNYWLYRINSAKDLLLYYNYLAVETGKKSFGKPDANCESECNEEPAKLTLVSSASRSA